MGAPPPRDAESREAAIRAQTLQRAVDERDRLLQAHPSLRPFQAKLDALLSKAGTTDNRMAVLSMMMQGKLSELGDQMQALNQALAKLTR